MEQPLSSVPLEPGSAHCPLTPVSPGERIVLVDALRGLALLGILVVNMGYFAHPFTSQIAGTVPPGGWLDRLVADAIRFLAAGKFYALFSLLFGLGLFVQMERSQSRSLPFKGRWSRRMLVLLAIGLAHGLLVWAGDILTVYAVLGFPLLAFRSRSSRTLVIWAAALLVVLAGLLGGVATFMAHDPGMAPVSAAGPDPYAVLSERALRIYGSGSVGQILQQRAADFARMFATFAISFGPSVFSMFLLGIWLGRKGVLREPTRHRRFLRRLLALGLAVGIPANVAFLVAHRALSATEGFVAADDAPSAATLASLVLGGPAFCLVYLSGASLLWLRETPRRALGALAPVGRMALTNYLMQSVVCTSIFYSYGLGLFGKVDAAVGLALTLLIYVAQVAASHWWLARFRFGPVEWLWRRLTYGRGPP
jgi:uncharacterized protein